MFNQIIADQRESLEKALKNEKLIKREFLSIYNSLLSSEMIKVITGPRRSGKSTLCSQMLHSKKYAYINFDDENLASVTAKDLNGILEAFYEIYKDPEFIFLDEIQNIEGWELFVNRLKRLGFNVVITGSNSHLLSKELSTHLTGRHYALNLYPFSFREFLLFMGIKYNEDKVFSTKTAANIKRALNDYILIGGFPESLNEEDPKRYIQSLYSSIITRDIALRHKIRFVRSIREIANYLISVFSSKITFNKLTNIFNIKSVHTVQNYVSFLEESYLIFLVERYSGKVKQRILAPRKVYAIDTGLINAVTDRGLSDKGRMLENMVAIELLRKKVLSNNMEFFYWQDRSGKEVDFVLKQNLKIKQLIQVCYDVSNYSTKERETGAIIKASRELKCSDLLIITQDYETSEKIKGKTIKYIPLWKWLLC